MGTRCIWNNTYKESFGVSDEQIKRICCELLNIEINDAYHYKYVKRSELSYNIYVLNDKYDKVYSELITFEDDCFGTICSMCILNELTGYEKEIKLCRFTELHPDIVMSLPVDDINKFTYKDYLYYEKSYLDIDADDTHRYNTDVIVIDFETGFNIVGSIRINSRFNNAELSGDLSISGMGTHDMCIQHYDKHLLRCDNCGSMIPYDRWGYVEKKMEGNGLGYDMYASMQCPVCSKVSEFNLMLHDYLNNIVQQGDECAEDLG